MPRYGHLREIKDLERGPPEALRGRRNRWRLRLRRHVVKDEHDNRIVVGVTRAGGGRR